MNCFLSPINMTGMVYDAHQSFSMYELAAVRPPPDLMNGGAPHVLIHRCAPI